jgi:hypothetical protein
MYTFPLQEGEATIEVRLLYRRAYQQLAEWKGWDDPDIEMAALTVTVKSENLEVAGEYLTLNAD